MCESDTKEKNYQHGWKSIQIVTGNQSLLWAYKNYTLSI